MQIAESKKPPEGDFHDPAYHCPDIPMVPEQKLNPYSTKAKEF